MRGIHLLRPGVGRLCEQRFQVRPLGLELEQRCLEREPELRRGPNSQIAP
jgi:hypothetical protein